MNFSQSLCDDLIVHTLGEGTIDEPFAVKMPEFALSQTVFGAAEAVRVQGDAGPAAEFLVNL